MTLGGDIFQLQLFENFSINDFSYMFEIFCTKCLSCLSRSEGSERSTEDNKTRSKRRSDRHRSIHI